jgi:hypothetical protein
VGEAGGVTLGVLRGRCGGGAPAEGGRGDPRRAGLRVGGRLPPRKSRQLTVES